LSKRFSNQTPEQILKHLKHFLDESVTYDLYIDTLNVNFFIRESIKKRKRGKISEKKKKLKELQKNKNLSKRQRKLIATKKRTRPKIRSVKKGRTVILKGRVY